MHNKLFAYTIFAYTVSPHLWLKMKTLVDVQFTYYHHTIDAYVEQSDTPGIKCACAYVNAVNGFHCHDEVLRWNWDIINMCETGRWGLSLGDLDSKSGSNYIRCKLLEGYAPLNIKGITMV